MPTNEIASSYSKMIMAKKVTVAFKDNHTIANNDKTNYKGMKGIEN